MRTLLNVVAFLAGAVALALFATFCWFYFYSRDLPDTRVMAHLAPTTETQVSDPCIGTSTAIPYEAIGANLRNAISAAETSEHDPSIIRATWDGFTEGANPHQRTTIASWYISRTMCYAPSRNLHREIAEFRAAIQLERRYSRRQLFTIWANRVNFGPGLVGVQAGSTFYFHKKPNELTVSEAVLLVGLIRSPSLYSPTNHPDRALRRRNEVLDAMKENGTISAADAERYKAAPLEVPPDAKKPVQTEFLSTPSAPIATAQVLQL